MKPNSLKIKFAGKRSFLSMSLILIFTVFSAFGQASKTNFSGTWNLNEGKSQLGEGPGRRAASKIVITQDANTLTAEKTSTRQSGESFTSTEKYNLDGDQSDNSGENRKRISTTSWSSDMKELTINSTTTFERNGNSMEMKSVEVYKLGSDGNSLVIETTSSSNRGEFKTSLYYDKAK